MLLTDGEIIKRLNIKPSDRVLDIGGSMMQHKLIKVDTLVDLIRPEDAPYGSSKLLAKHFVKTDISRESLPFKDKEFDICLCTHTLEDLPTPFPIMDEMSRVAKRGLIVTPSMGEDMKFTPIDFTDWLIGARRVPGQAHHKWFFVKDKGGLKVIPKNYPVLYTSEFSVTGWTGEKEMEYVWQGKINYKEFSGLNIHNLIDEYKKFIDNNKDKITTGTVAIFIDNPFNIFKAWGKRILRRGDGYKYRKKQ
jgi:ubiquinone/menaquinone biosynthesis C-methylase UbiE